MSLPSRRCQSGLRVAFLLLPFCGGCSYLQNRLADTLDLGSADIGYGPGVYVEARATDFLMQGLGPHSYWEAYSWHGRYAGAVEHWRGFGLPPLFTLSGYMPAGRGLAPVLGGDPERYELASEPPAESLFVFWPGAGIGLSESAPYSVEKRGLRVADLGVHVQCLVGLRLGFSPGETVDWLFGWFGLDLAGDDEFGGQRSQRRPANQGADQRGDGSSSGSSPSAGQ